MVKDEVQRIVLASQFPFRIRLHRAVATDWKLEEKFKGFEFVQLSDDGPWTGTPVMGHSPKNYTERVDKITVGDDKEPEEVNWLVRVNNI